MWLEMNPGERANYNQSAISTRLGNLISEGNPAKTFELETGLVQRRQACCGAGVLQKFMEDRKFRSLHGALAAPSGRKLRALVEDLLQLRQTEPALHAVVFTHHTIAYEAICKRLRKEGFEVCGFTGGVPADKRHQTIRAFQASAEALDQRRAATAAQARQSSRRCPWGCRAATSRASKPPEP